jgi:hypothetical protein
MDIVGPKRVLDLSRCDPDPTVGSLALGAVVVPRVGARTGRAGPLAPAAGLRALAPSSLYQLPGSRPGELAALSSAIDGLAVWDLEVGPDVDQVPEALDDLLAASTEWSADTGANLAGAGVAHPAGLRQ